MRQYKFDKPLVETEVPFRDTSVYFVDVDERTKELANIMEFVDGKWTVKHFIDSIDIWERSSERLGIPGNKVALNPDGIIAAWLNGSEYESNVKEAAADFPYIVGEVKALVQIVTDSITSLNGIVDSVRTGSAGSEEASVIEAIVSNLNGEGVSRIVTGNGIEQLENLEEAIDGTSNVSNG